MSLDPCLDASPRPTSPPPEAAELPEGVTTLADALRELVATLPGLRAALDRQSESKPRVERLAYRLDELADALGVSRRLLERERAAGRFRAADLHIGRVPLWRVETVTSWRAKGGA